MDVNELYNERELLLQIAKGDESAFRRLYDRNGPRLLQYTLRLTGQREQGEDVVQNTFLKIWLKRETLPHIDDFSAYLFRMARNAIVSSIRQAALEAVIVRDKLSAPSSYLTPDQQAEQNELNKSWKAAVQKLPLQQQKVYLLQKEYGWKIEDIAVMMSISPRTVKRHLADAQQTLRHSMTSHFPKKELLIILFLGALHT